MKSNAAGCGSISTVISSIVLLCISSIIIIIRLLRLLRQNGICGDLINILNDFLTNRKQRVVLNGQCSSWFDIQAGVSQVSILGPLSFLIYVNDLPDDLKSECKLFADDTSLFSVVHGISTSASDINNNLANWAFQWKMSFNPDPSKQAQEIKFSRKKNEVIPPKCVLQ